MQTNSNRGVSFKNTLLVFLKTVKGLHWRPVVKNQPWNAGDAGSIPGQGSKIQHAGEELSPHDTTREPVLHEEDPGGHS